MSGKGAPVVHGHARAGRRSKEFIAWSAMKQRCTDAKHEGYPYYGGRGLRVCARWLASFEKFLNDVGPAPSRKHTLDRIQPDGDYEPGNVRWATASEQRLNQRSDRKPGGPRKGDPRYQGARHPSAKLTAVQREEICRKLAAGGVTTRDLAAEYGVGKSTISAVWLARRSA